MTTQMVCVTLVVVGFFSCCASAFAESPAVSTRSVTGRIDPAAATGVFSGGGVVLTAEDLRRIAVRKVNSSGAADETQGPRGGGGRILIVECTGAFGYETIQSAVDDALDGDTVVILPSDCSQDGRWHESVALPDTAIRIQSANPDIDAVVDATIIDGGQSPYVFQNAPQAILSVVFDGLTIRSFSNGLVFNITAPTIRRCKFVGIAGSAIRLLANGPATIESCEFEGGSLQDPSIYSTHVVPHVVNCRFAGLGDRAIQVVSQGGPDCDDEECGGVFGCDFIDNANRVIDVGTEKLVLRESMFSGNGGPCVTCGPLSMSDCQFENNVQVGGQLVVSSDIAEIERCDFVGNEAAGQLVTCVAKMSLLDCSFDANAATIGVVKCGGGSVMERCYFTNNDGVCYFGGADRITDSLFVDNRAGNLMLVWGLAQDTVIERTDFINNSTASLQLIRMSFGLDMRDCGFESNSATNGSILQVVSESTIEECVFSGNVSRHGTIDAQNGSQSSVSHCSFTGNSASLGAGAISSLTGGEIANCLFIDNSTQASGGAVSVGGTTISNSLFVGNIAVQNGGAVNGFANMSESTVVGNIAGNLGGGVFGGIIENSIIYDNRGPVLNGRDFSQIGPTGRLSFCDIQGLAALAHQLPALQVGHGVICADPRFVDPGHWDDMGTPEDMSDDVFIAGDYHLLSNSPCIDGGAPTFPADAGVTDLDDEPRVMSCRVDMGVDEFTQGDVGVIGDFDGDGAVSVDDLPAFLSFMLDPYGLGTCEADINDDGAVNGLDVSAMAGLILGA